MAKERVGFIGLGLMGRGMAANILAKGWPLTALAHRRREALDELVGRGAREAATPRALAQESDIVLLCVTGSPQVEEVIGGKDGLASAGKPLLVVDCSTSDPSVTRQLAARFASQGITLIDAPLSRTPKHAAAGTLHVMVGGEEAAVSRARPVLEACSERIVHTGATGSAHTMKLLNNFISMGYASLYSEALAVGAKSGVTAEVFNGVLGGSSMDCPFYQFFFQYVLKGDPSGVQFTLRNALKDMTYMASLAGASGAVNPMGAAVRSSFATAVAAGRGDDYVPTLSDAVAVLNGLDPARKA